tara:strand:- start:63 stop:464 length:402 start_codon:yes stop_codon:yes gene_type:complete
MSNVVFQTSTTASAILKGKGRHQQLSALPKVEKLLNLSLYPIKTRPSIASSKMRVTLQIDISEDSGIYATAVQDILIPHGLVPDINLVAYLIGLNSENHGLSPKEFVDKVDNNGGESNFHTYWFNLTLYVEAL